MAFLSWIFISFLAIQVCGLSRLYARVDYSKTKPFVIPLFVSEEEAYTTQEIKGLLPADITPQSDGKMVMNKIADRSLQLWWNKSHFKHTSVGRVAESVERKLRADVSLQGSSEHSIEHKFSLQVLAAQAVAKIEYVGWVKAAFRYYSREAKTETQLYETIYDKDLVLTHTVASEENMSSLQIRWNW